MKDYLMWFISHSLFFTKIQHGYFTQKILARSQIIILLNALVNKSQSKKARQVCAHTSII